MQINSINLAVQVVLQQIQEYRLSIAYFLVFAILSVWHYHNLHFQGHWRFLPFVLLVYWQSYSGESTPAYAFQHHHNFSSLSLTLLVQLFGLYI